MPLWRGRGLGKRVRDLEEVVEKCEFVAKQVAGSLGLNALFVASFVDGGQPPASKTTRQALQKPHSTSGCLCCDMLN